MVDRVKLVTDDPEVEPNDDPDDPDDSEVGTDLRRDVARLEAAIRELPLDAVEARRELQARHDSHRRDLRAAELAARRATKPLPPAVTARAAVEAEDRALALSAPQVADPAPLATQTARGAISRATSEVTLVASDRRERERYAFGLYAELRTDAEVITAVRDAYGVSEHTARADLRAVRAVAASWRDQTEWTDRRDQHVMGLRRLFDLALAKDDLDLARKLMAQIAAVEGFNAALRSQVDHRHVHTTLPSGPGIVAGFDVRAMPRDQRAALLLLLPASADEIERVVEADAIEADSAEVASGDE